MGTFFVYILKAAVCLAFFYLFYRLLLSRETFHRFNRIALLGILLLSLLIPLIEVSIAEQTEVHQAMLTWEQILLMADNAPETTTVLASAEEMTVSWVQLALLLYLVGIVFFACRHVYTLVRLLMLVCSGRREQRDHGIVIVVHQKEIAPFSWMKYVVISEKDLGENGREILIHEEAHIRNRHSVDLLMAEVCIFFQWFNPAAWLLKQELQNIHEYEADETVIRAGVNAKQYQLLLIKKAVGTRLYSMANSLNHSSLKKRITMMLKEKSNPWARLKYLYVLPLAAVAVTTFARPEVSNKAEEISVVKVNDLAAIVETKVQETVNVVLKDTVKRSVQREQIYTTVDQLPEFPGRAAGLKDYFTTYRVYPSKAKEAGIQGRVMVRFVVSKDGRVCAPEVTQSVNKELDKEAIRLIAAMPKWKPGMLRGKAVAVAYTLPIDFSLVPAPAATSDEGTPFMYPNGVKQNPPLVMIDDQEVSLSVLGALKPDCIETITVLKDSSAIVAYSGRGKNGAILITLKKPTPSLPVNKSTQKEKHLIVSGLRIDSLKASTNENGSFLRNRTNEIRVSGKVQDVEGHAIPGASVLIQGTTRGTVADADGTFMIEAPKDANLAISSVDKVTIFAKVSKDPIFVTLKDE